MESYIKSFNLGISLRLDLLFFREKEAKPLSSAKLVHFRQTIEYIAETYLIKSSPASNTLRMTLSRIQIDREAKTAFMLLCNVS